VLVSSFVQAFKEECTMRVLQISGNSKYGGATYLMLEWSKYLLDRGCDVDILTTDPTMIEEANKTPGMRVIDSIFIPREIDPVADLRGFWRLCSLIRREQYDVVHTYTATPSFLGRMAARLMGVPVIVNHQGGWAVNEFSSLTQRIFYTPLEYIANLANTRNICVCHAEAYLGRKQYLAPPSRLVTICNGIKPEPFRQAQINGSRAHIRNELGIADNEIAIGTTGRLVPGKDNASLIRAFHRLKQLVGERPMRLVLAGDGLERSELEQLVAELELQEHVIFLGFWQDIPGFLAGIDIFVTPTLSEGMSVSLLEAMAAARPIIATNILPNAELITDQQTGLLVPTKAPEQIAQALARFIDDPALAQWCSEGALKRVLRYYTIERMFQETWDLYIDLLAIKKPEWLDVQLRGS
jgi:glycosyltransferase involved in cell wall biosynthesis